jgi:type IV pilus assembly protein PilC
MRSLRIIADQVESRELAGVLNEIVADVEQGQPFSRALTKHPKVFSPFWVSLVEVGEASGTMPKVLEKLTLYMEEAAAFRSHIVGALIYPGVLFTICVGAILVFAVVIGPTFERIFAEMDVKLPVITQMLMGLFKIIQTKFLFIIGGFIGAFFIFKSYIKTPVGRKNFELFLFGLPGFGNVFKLIVVEKFCSQMAILIDSGVPILYALEIAERLVDNLVCGEHIKHVRDGVREGRLLAEPMEQSGFFPPMAVQMIRVGEETGELGQMLNHVAVFYKKQVEAVMKTFGTLIEPVMLVVMGGIIGVMVVAMFMPILSLSTGG